MSFSEQVLELFSKFNDHTILLDSKTGRLPKFRDVKRQPSDNLASTVDYLVADGEGKRWCAAVQEGSVDECAISSFDAFCRVQQPRPSRKIVITKTGIDQNAKLLAKTANMWVWEAEELNMLRDLYGHA